ncbi:MAG: aspartate--tRNA(Asn) ligase [Thermoplasmatota archaeon]
MPTSPEKTSSLDPVSLRARKYATAITPAMNGERVVLAGWVQETRILGKIAFHIVRDRTGTAQVILKKAALGDERFAALTGFQRESVVKVVGTVKANTQARNGYEIAVETADDSITVLNPAEAPLPLGVVDKVDADLETRLDKRFMDLRKPEIAAIFKIRSTLVKAGVDYFTNHGFVQVHTPRIIGASSEGGTDLFAVKYFERDAFLAQSPQLYKQMLMATGLDRQFEVATYFRAEKHNTYRHLNEITAFDVEMAFIEDEEDVMKILEGAMHHVWKHVAETNVAELTLLKKEVKVPALPFPRVTYDEAAKLTGVSWGEDLNTEAEKKLGEIMKERGHEFYFITRYPEAIKPFYAYVDDANPTLSRSFDLEHNGLEVTSGAQREHRLAHLTARMHAKGLDPKDFEDYLKAFRYGMPPHGGFGLGIDRLTMEILGLPNVREAVLFPRDRTRLRP